MCALSDPRFITIAMGGLLKKKRVEINRLDKDSYAHISKKSLVTQCFFLNCCSGLLKKRYRQNTKLPLLKIMGSLKNIFRVDIYLIISPV